MTKEFEPNKDVESIVEELQQKIEYKEHTEPHYQWKPDSQLSISGAEFEWLMHTLRTYINQPKAQEVLAMAQSLNIVENVMRKGIEAGTITEVSKPSE